MKFSIIFSLARWTLFLAWLAPALTHADGFAFPPARYYGLITYQSQAVPNDSGSIEIRVGKDGRYSGKASTGEYKYRFQGTLNAQGEDTTSFKVRIKTLDSHINFRVGRLQLALDLDGLRLTGHIDYGDDFGGKVLDFEALPAWTGTSSSPVPGAGTYHCLLDDVSGAPSSEGHGFGTVQIAANGRVKIVGRLTDGKPFTVGTQVCRDGFIPVFERLRNPQAILQGWMQWVQAPEPALTGTLDWNITGPGSNPPDPQSSYRSLILTGWPYAPPEKGHPILPLDPELLELGNESAGLDWVALVRINQRNKFEWLEGDLMDLKVRVNPKTGWLTGKFTRPDTGTKASLYGLILPDGESSLGYFQSPQGGGYLRLLPRE
jgi:hypothetical protein